MRLLYFFICFLASCLFSLVLSFIHQEITYTNFQALAALEMRKPIFSQYFDNHQVEFKKKNVHIQIKGSERFESLPHEEQFVVLSLFHKQLKYKLKYGRFFTADYPYNPLYMHSLQLHVKTGKQTYTYLNTHSNKGLIFSSQGKLVFGSKVLTQQKVRTSMWIYEKYIVPIQNDKTSNGHYEKDVLDYIINYAKLLTKNMKKIDLVDDFPIIERLVLSKFNISRQELYNIYSKWTGINYGESID
ncbi:hypothetical protein [Bacillus sp. 1P06AnD]|uniref:hypothetical protein n=1 Tax=Bacillus sp. 1P06AnD TaxID=3132208 RepID=UPI0039A02F86